MARTAWSGFAAANRKMRRRVVQIRDGSSGGRFLIADKIVAEVADEIFAEVKVRVFLLRAGVGHGDGGVEAAQRGGRNVPPAWFPAPPSLSGRPRASARISPRRRARTAAALASFGAAAIILKRPVRSASGADKKKSTCEPSCDSRQAKLALFKPITPDAASALSHGNLRHRAGRVGIRLRLRNLREHGEKSFRVEPAVIQRRVAELREFVGGENGVVVQRGQRSRRSGARRRVRRP